jgi:cell division protein FtsB
MRFLNSIYGFLIAIGFIVFILLYSCFGERGLMNVLSLEKKLKETEYYSQNLAEENNKLKNYIYLLKNDKRYVEKIAREELGLVRTDELIYLFENN